MLTEERLAEMPWYPKHVIESEFFTTLGVPDWNTIRLNDDVAAGVAQREGRDAEDKHLFSDADGMEIE